MGKVCEVCGKPIVEGQEYATHGRLGVYIHADCPMTNVKGEDVTLHAMLWRVQED